MDDHQRVTRFEQLAAANGGRLTGGQAGRLWALAASDYLDPDAREQAAGELLARVAPERPAVERPPVDSGPGLQRGEERARAPYQQDGWAATVRDAALRAGDRGGVAGPGGVTPRGAEPDAAHFDGNGPAPVAPPSAAGSVDPGWAR